jgi:co-chaperonin GroES (HSP10)
LLLEVKENMIKAMRDQVLLDPFPDDIRGTPLVGKSLLIAPGQYTEPSRLAKVVAVGSEVLDIKPGWTVMCNRYPHSAWEIRWEGRKYVSVKADEIEARVEIN